MKFRLSLNDMAVPLEKKTMTVIDPHQLAHGLDLDLEETVEISLGSFKAIADMWWFLKALKLESKWWKFHHGQIPLLLEIRENVKNIKNNIGARYPKEHGSMVILHVREKILFVQNLQNIVVLGLRGTPGAPQGTPEDEIGALQWFLKELEKDIEKLLSLGEPEQDQPTNKGSAQDEDQEFLEVIQDCTKNLQKHPNCHSAFFVPSRSCFRVRTKDKRFSEFRVKNLKRKRSLEEEKNQEFHKVLSMALVFLGSSDSGPSLVEPDEDCQTSDVQE